jgi:hypothetical protein
MVNRCLLRVLAMAEWDPLVHLTVVDVRPTLMLRREVVHPVGDQGVHLIPMQVVMPGRQHGTRRLALPIRMHLMAVELPLGTRRLAPPIHTSQMEDEHPPGTRIHEHRIPTFRIQERQVHGGVIQLVAVLGGGRRLDRQLGEIQLTQEHGEAEGIQLHLCVLHLVCPSSAILM